MECKFFIPFSIAMKGKINCDYSVSFANKTVEKMESIAISSITMKAEKQFGTVAILPVMKG
jgi:hypothetical protein